MGNLEKRKECHQLALEIYKEQLGLNHSNVATSYNNLALVYKTNKSIGNQEKKKEYPQSALEIGKEPLGPNNFDVANSHNVTCEFKKRF
jgi:hypothetical protein